MILYICVVVFIVIIGVHCVCIDRSGNVKGLAIANYKWSWAVFKNDVQYIYLNFSLL